MCVCVCACALSHFSCVQLFVTLWTEALQAPLSMGQARIVEWLLCLPPGDLLDPEIEPASLTSPTLAVSSLPLVPPGKPIYIYIMFIDKSAQQFHLI